MVHNYIQELISKTALGNSVVDYHGSAHYLWCVLRISIFRSQKQPKILIII